MRASKIDNADNFQDEFEKYWQEQKKLASAKLCDDEHLDKEQFNALNDTYIFSGHEPLRDEVLRGFFIYFDLKLFIGFAIAALVDR